MKLWKQVIIALALGIIAGLTLEKEIAKYRDVLLNLLHPTGTKIITLGSVFTNGIASPEINKGSGDIIYLDNRAIITRNTRQKEDIKIILEF